MLEIDSLPLLSKWKIVIAKSRFAPLIRKFLGHPEVGAWSNHFRFNPSQYSIEKAKTILGYTVNINFEEGMILTENWLKVNDYLKK